MDRSTIRIVGSSVRIPMESPDASLILVMGYEGSHDTIERKVISITPPKDSPTDANQNSLLSNVGTNKNNA